MPKTLKLQVPPGEGALIQPPWAHLTTPPTSPPLTTPPPSTTPPPASTSSTSSTPPTPPRLIIKLPFSKAGGVEIQKIESTDPKPATTATEPPVESLLSHKRASDDTPEGQPKSKKTKVQSADTEVEQSTSDNVLSLKAQQDIIQRHNYTADKPEPFGQPPMFAHTRGGLCETVHYFKANQGSAYQNRSIGNKSRVFGFLCDGGVGVRDFFGDEVIICSIGGNREKDEKTGKMVLKSDHKADYQLAMSFMNSMNSNQAVIACVGQSNTKFPVKLHNYYSVLGWFHITDVWYDKFEKSCWMMRAEAVDLTTRPHWSAKAAPWTPSSPSAPRAPILRCASCKKDTKEIYTIGWFCMTPKCTSYYRQSGQEVPIENLHFTEVFLQERTQFHGQVPAEIAPVFPSNLISGPATAKLNAEIKQGFVCPVCNCCCRRIRWNYFQCETKGCDTKFKIPRKVLTVPQVILKKPKPTTIKGFFKGGITCITVPLGGYEVDIYDMPDRHGNAQNCYTFHFRSNKAINSQPFGPDYLFSTLQQEDLDLKRGPAKTANRVVEMLTNHFTKNYGATYKFVVPQDSDGFGLAPDVILRILMRNTWAAEAAVTQVGADYIAPNELLGIGYQKPNKMKYHDDGEDTLAPTVTSLSLGGGAVMKWRRKKVLAGRGASKQGEQKASKDVLQIYLQHGDFMAMHGSGIQKVYEHSVTPDGNLRFAWTARTILCDKIKGAAERKHAIKAGIIPARAATFRYDGDAALKSGHDDSSSGSLNSAENGDVSYGEFDAEEDEDDN